MKKFGFYFKKGFVLAKMAMKGKSLFTKLLLGLYLILSFFGKIIFFLRPIFLIADSNLAMMIVEGHDFEFEKLFEGVNAKKRYSSLLLSAIFVDGLALMGALIMVLPFLIWNFTLLYNVNVPPIIFVIIFGIAAVALGITIYVVYAPMGFVACKGKDLSAGDILYLAKEGSASNKGKIVGLFLVNYLILILVLAVFIALPIFLGSYFIVDYDVAIFVNFIDLFLFIGLMLLEVFVLSYVKLSVKISMFSLFYDSVETKHIIIAKHGSTKDAFVPLFTDDKEVKDNE